jgi:hypothetical protein
MVPDGSRAAARSSFRAFGPAAPHEPVAIGSLVDPAMPFVVLACAAPAGRD